MNKEWEEGYQAFKDGLELEDNPYADLGEFSPQFCDWQTGWECSESDCISKDWEAV